ncbi:MAG TPA: hypothetical protein VFO41_06220 [Alphaproteobacteria bacterium]|nr:hypothetical protein [Alphaproteobacteria bacterium]
MSTHRYPLETLRADYARGALGLVLTGAPLVALSPHWSVALALAAAALLFVVFLGRTAQRHLTVVEMGNRGIVASGPLGGAIAWPDLRDLRLHYFSTRRDRTKGWMHLTLKGGGRTLKLESTITGFDDIAERASDAARANGLALRETTVNNLIALGIEPPESERRAAGGA